MQQICGNPPGPIDVGGGKNLVSVETVRDYRWRPSEHAMRTKTSPTASGHGPDGRPRLIVRREKSYGGIIKVLRRRLLEKGVRKAGILP